MALTDLWPVRGETVVIKTANYRSVAFGLCLLLMVGSVAASDFDAGFGFTGIKAGIIGSGKVKMENAEAEQSTGFNFGLDFDLPFGEKLHYGAAIDVMRMSWQIPGASPTFDESELLIDIGIRMKALIQREDSPLAFRPGVGIGLGVLPRFGPFRGSNYLTLRAFGEFIYFPDSGPGWLIEVGTWYAPNGGDGAFDISIGPLLTMRAGLLF